MPQATIPLSIICQQAGVSRQTAYRVLGDSNPARAPYGHRRFSPEEVPEKVALLKSKQKRRRRNAFNSVFCVDVAR